ncbi:MAG: hypothetical protein GQ558_06235, partial [Thermoplasmata archaeon]|nr:hypothetical protein [Thermoplasmata archaeon]
MSFSPNKILIIFSGILIISAGFATVLTMPEAPSPLIESERQILRVGADGGYETVRSAMSVSQEGDTILLGPGTWDEPIVIDKPLTLEGTVDKDGNLLTDITAGIVVTKNNYRHPSSSTNIRNLIFRDIRSPALSHWRAPTYFGWNSAAITTMPWGLGSPVITGLIVNNCQFYDCWQGIYLTGAKDAVIEDCTFQRCYRGITIRPQYVSPTQVWDSSGHDIIGCNFLDGRYRDYETQKWSDTENGEGIAIFDSDSNLIDGCVFEGNTYGLHIYKGDNNRIVWSEISNSTVASMSFREVTQTLTVADNTIREDGKPILFYKSNGFTFQRNDINGATLTLVNSTNGQILENDFGLTSAPALSISTLDHHFNHNIGEDNEIGGEPIYYFYNEPSRVVLRGRTASAVYIMDCDNALVTEMNVIEGDGIVVQRSNGLAIEDTKVTNNIFGIDILDSTDLVVTRTTADVGGRGDYAIHLNNVTNAYVNNSIVRTYEMEPSFKLSGDSDCHVHNTSFNGSTVQVRRDDGGVLRVSNELNIRIRESDTLDPYPDGHVLVTQDSDPAYATPFYGGIDPVTRANGMVGPISLTDRVYFHSNTPIEYFHSIQVSAEEDGFWAESRPNLDMSMSRTELFDVEDIWAPGSPTTVQVRDLPDEDAIEVSWVSPLDIDTREVTLYWNVSGGWEDVVTLPSANSIHKISSGLVHGTSYWFRLTAWDNEALESLPTPAFGVVHKDWVTPSAPADLIASNISAFSCELDWTAVPDEDLVGYHVYMNDTGVGPTGPWVKVSPSNGVSSNLFQVNGLISETTYFFAVSAFDEAPNESPHSPTIKVDTPDVTPPNRPLFDKLPPYTNQAQLTVSGLSEPGTMVAIYIDGEEVGTTVANEEKRFNLAINLTEGPNVISARATDPSGNKGTFSREVIVVLDTITPDAPILDPLPAITGKVTLTITGMAEGGSAVAIFIDGEEAATTESIMYVGFSVRVTLMEGKNVICAQATDRALNVGPRCTEVEVVLDTVPPLEPELDELPTMTNEPTLEVSGVAEPESSVEVYLGEYMAGSIEADEVGRFTVGIELLEGSNYLSVRAIDAALNPSRATLPREILLDTIPPVVYIGEDIEAVEYTEVTFDGSTSYDNEGITDFVWTFTVDNEAQTIDGDVLRYTFDHPMEVLLTLTATDAVGNSGSASIMATIVTSNRPPVLTLGKVNPPEGHTATSFQFDVTFTDADGEIGTVNLVLDGETH